MRFSKNVCLAASLAICLSVPVSDIFAERPTLVVRVEKKQTAALQLQHARSLIATVIQSKPGIERHQAVANAASNLMAVEKGWPGERSAIREANALLAKLYLDNGMPQNALDATAKGLQSSQDHRLLYTAARIYARTGRNAEAKDAFTRAEHSFDPAYGTRTENIGILNQVAFFWEQEKEHEQAARVLRRAAALESDYPLVRLGLLQRTLEQSAKSPNRAQARKDLDALREAWRAAFAIANAPEQRVAVDLAESAIRTYGELLR